MYKHNVKLIRLDLENALSNKGPIEMQKYQLDEVPYTDLERTDKILACLVVLKEESKARDFIDWVVGSFLLFEISVEHITQSIILLLVTLSTITNTSNVELLSDSQEVKRGSSWYLILMTLISVLRMPRGYVKYLSALKKGLSMKAKFVLLLYFSLNILTRLMSIVIFFAPALGLLDFLYHNDLKPWFEGETNFIETENGTCSWVGNFVKENEVYLIEEYSPTSLTCIFISFVIVHFLIVFGIKHFIWRRFQTVTSFQDVQSSRAINLFRLCLNLRGLIKVIVYSRKILSHPC